MATIRLPNDKQRTVIIGKTGSGKTVAACWHLSERSFDRMPWIVFDFKYDDLLAEIPMEEIDVKKAPPKKPGLYVVRPRPDQVEKEVEQLLWNIWAQEHTGIYIDEGYMVGDSPAFRAILTQGRSKHIPVIVLSQRPVWMSRFVFSEADFFQTFWLNDARDRKTVQSFLPFDLSKRLDDFHSYYYDVGKDQAVVMRPVPSGSEILERFAERLVPKRRII